MQYTVPRPFYEKLAERLGDRSSAEQFVASLETVMQQIVADAHKIAADQTGGIKMELKEELSNTLVTRDLFETRIQAIQDHIDQRFAVVDERFLRFENRIDERFKRNDLKFNLLIGILLFGFTLFNPGFLELVKLILK